MMFIIQLLLPVASELQLYIRATQLNMYYSHTLRGSSFFFINILETQHFVKMRV